MFSLIVATINRVDEVERLLASLDSQSFRAFEVIIIDQNRDDRLVPVLERHYSLAIHHLRSERGAGRARNQGLRIASGEVICFPDDDCWYPPDVLQSVDAWFDHHSDFDGLFTMMRDAHGEPVGLRWPRDPGLVTRTNLWDATIFVTAFLRRSVTDAVGLFREDIGVGAATPYQSGEESDYFLRALALGCRMWYEPSLTVYHPNLHGVERLSQRAYPYALGTGYVLRLHRYPWWQFARFFARSLGGFLLNLARGNLAMARIYALRAAGQFRGYFFGPRDLRRSSGVAE